MIKHILFYCLFTVLTVGLSVSAHAKSYKTKAKAIVDSRIKEWTNTPSIIDAIKAQNIKHKNLTQSEIEALDKKWRAGDEEIIQAVLTNELSQHLSSIKEAGEGLYTEIFVMDNKGLNVGQSDKTSDYWQGDEEKWQKTFLGSRKTLHISKIEEDESAQAFQIQITLPVTDAGKIIGAITVGINAEMLDELASKP